MAPFMWKGAGHAWLQRRVQEPMLVPSLTKTISRPSPGMPRSLTETHAPWKQMFTHLHASLPPPPLTGKGSVTPFLLGTGCGKSRGHSPWNRVRAPPDTITLSEHWAGPWACCWEVVSLKARHRVGQAQSG